MARLLTRTRLTLRHDGTCHLILARPKSDTLQGRASEWELIHTGQKHKLRFETSKWQLCYSTTHCQYMKATAKRIFEDTAGTVALHTALAFVKGMSEEVVTGFTKRRFKDFKS